MMIAPALTRGLWGLSGEGEVELKWGSGVKVGQEWWVVGLTLQQNKE